MKRISGVNELDHQHQHSTAKTRVALVLDKPNKIMHVLSIQLIWPTHENGDQDTTIIKRQQIVVENKNTEYRRMHLISGKWNESQIGRKSCWANSDKSSPSHTRMSWANSDKSSPRRVLHFFNVVIPLEVEREQKTLNTLGVEESSSPRRVLHV